MNANFFADPPTDYRPVPFWSWNDTLEIPRLLKQLAAFKEAGIGGFFMHSRPGIATPFLGPDWFTAVTTSIDYAKQHDMKAWIYDESSYPSGFAGGFVPAARPDLASQSLSCRHITENNDVTQKQDDGIGRFAVKENGYRRLQHGERAEKDAIELSFNIAIGQPADWMNGFPYTDLLNPDTAKTFIAIALEPYRQRYASEFSHTIPGVFTDEPHLVDLPWSPLLPQLYFQRYKEDILERLPELFLETGEYGVTRCRFWRLVSEQFIEAWMRPIYEWCSQNNLQLTGHLWEHLFHPRQSGSIMAPLEYMHLPGLDLLGRDVPHSRLPQDDHVPAQMGNIHMVKVVSSVAHQLGRSRVLSETYGGGGWDMSFETQKQYAEWEYALGVNFLNQHLSHYSLRGFRKHDYPISFLDYQPWWPSYRLLNDYFGRLSYAMSQGKYEAQLLILHPMASLWVEAPQSISGLTTATEKATTRVKAMQVSLDHLLKMLSAKNWAYDFGDDLLLEKYGGVDSGKPDEPPRLQVGEMQYKAVIIPPCTTLLSGTVRLLSRFIDAGGQVISLVPAPSRLDGAATGLDGFLDRCTQLGSLEELENRLEMLERRGQVARMVRTTSSSMQAPIYSIERTTPEGNIIFLANMGDTAHLQETVFLGGTGDVERWDLVTSAVETLPADVQSSGVTVVLDFAKAESHLLFQRLPGSQARLQAPSRSTVMPVHKGRHQPIKKKMEHVLAGQWLFQPKEPNVMVLDRLNYRIGKADWSELVFTSEMAYRVRQHYGVHTFPFRDKQPWYKYMAGRPSAFPDMVELRYQVLSDLHDQVDLDVVVEDAGDFMIEVNGQILDTQNTTAWFDPAFKRVAIGTAWKKGENTISIRFRFHDDLPLEPAFILGRFALTAMEGHRWRLVEPTQELSSGSWVEQGYPFYVGCAVYSQEITLDPSISGGKIWLELSDLANVTTVYCNGQKVGLIAWSPYRIDLSGFLRAGRNTIELHIANSLHNALGPIHSYSSEPIIGPAEYVHSHCPNWKDAYRLAPDGLSRQAKLVWE